MPFFCPKKEEKTRCLWAPSSSLTQRYNISRRNPNPVNISQHSINSQFAANCSRRGSRCIILRGNLEFLISQFLITDYTDLSDTCLLGFIMDFTNMVSMARQVPLVARSMVGLIYNKACAYLYNKA